MIIIDYVLKSSSVTKSNMGGSVFQLRALPLRAGRRSDKLK